MFVQLWESCLNPNFSQKLYNWKEKSVIYKQMESLVEIRLIIFLITIIAN